MLARTEGLARDSRRHKEKEPIRVPANRFNGYDHRVKHPCRMIRFGFELGAIEDTRRIDAWLTGAFGIAPGSIPAAPDLDRGGNTALAHAMLNRALLLYREMMWSCNFPIFEGGKVLQVARSDAGNGGFRAAIAVAFVDNLQHVDFIAKFVELAKLVFSRASIDPTPEDGARLRNDIMASLIEPARKNNPFEMANRTLCDVAFRQQVPFRHLGGGVLQIGTGARAQLFYATAAQSDSSVGAIVSTDKRLAVGMYGAAGLPVPENRLVTSREQALAAARELGWPVVVKPNDSTRAEGVTVGIEDEAALIEAFNKARTTRRNILVERVVAGHVHRVLVVNGKVIYAGIRYANAVVGNGKDSIEALVEQAKADEDAKVPWKRERPKPLDEKTDKFLATRGMTRQSVPAEGEVVELRRFPSQPWGAYFVNVTDSIHPDNVQLAADAARLIGLTVAGVDIVSPDISQPWHANGAAILELNYGPQIAWLQREHLLPRILPELIEGDGRIPVHVVTGKGDLLRKARRLREKFAEEGRVCHLTTADHSEDSSGNAMHLTANTLFDRSLALSLRSDVHGLIMVGRVEELTGKGLAVDRIDTLVVVDGNRGQAEQLIRQLRERFHIRSSRYATP